MSDSEFKEDESDFKDLTGSVHSQLEEIEAKPKSDFNTIYVVPDSEKITSNLMTRFEFANIIGVRATMIENTGVYYAENIQPEDNLNARNIALIELKQKKIPLKLRR